MMKLRRSPAIALLTIAALTVAALLAGTAAYAQKKKPAKPESEQV